MDRLKELLDAALLAVAEGDHRCDLQLTASLPVRGNRAMGELMIVGRAMTGRGEGWRPQEALDPQRRTAIIERVMPSALATGECPMSWIARDWGSGFLCRNCNTRSTRATVPCMKCGSYDVQRRYDTSKSPLYRVMQAVTNALRLADTTQSEWPSYLMWTNLYKIAPTGVGTPSQSLVTLQHHFCVQMLNEEISEWKPKRILFLTGLDWAEPFLSEIGVAPRQVNGLVSHAGRIVLPAVGVDAAFVVGPHPQGKPEAELVSQIVQAFSSLENGEAILSEPTTQQARNGG
jgi:hypothetical protein